MTDIARRTIVIAVAAISIPVAFGWSAVIGDLLAGLVQRSIKSGEAGTNLNAMFFPMFLQLAFCALVVALALSIVVLFWDIRMGSKAKNAVLVLLLLVLLPISAVNFSYGDHLMKPSVQVVLDLMLLALGLTTSIELGKVEVNGTLLQVLKGLAIFLLFMEAVVIPGAYAILFLLYAQGVSISGVGDKLVAIMGGIISAVVTIAGFLRNRTKKELSQVTLG
jgi:hypothetical protein